MGVIDMRADSLVTNPPAGASHLTDGGSDWLWAVTAIYTVCFLAFVGLSIKPRNGESIFNYIFTLALLVGSISWFSMAGDLGFTVVATEFHRNSAETYQVFFVKYINWVVAFPLVTVALGLISGISWATIVYNVTLSWVWVISYLCGAFVQSAYKWGFFTFGTIAYFLLAYQTLGAALPSAKRVEIVRDYYILAGWTNLIWLLYPIAWAVSDASNMIDVTSSFIYFGILDVLFVPVLAFGFFVFSFRWDYTKLNLHFTRYGRVATSVGSFPEKNTISDAGAITATPAANSEEATTV